MRTDLDQLLTAMFRGIRPRDGFGPELLAEMLSDRHRLSTIGSVTEHSRRGWLVAGAVAGVISATGVVYVAARRHHKGAA